MQRGALFRENTLPNVILSVKIAVTEKYGTLSREGNTMSVASPSHRAKTDSEASSERQDHESHTPG